VLNHDFECVSARLFAELRPCDDVSADHGLKDRADVDEEVARAHDYAAHYA
jgi:hypothetical protein